KPLDRRLALAPARLWREERPRSHRRPLAVAGRRRESLAVPAGIALPVGGAVPDTAATRAEPDAQPQPDAAAAAARRPVHHDHGPERQHVLLPELGQREGGPDGDLAQR